MTLRVLAVTLAAILACPAHADSPFVQPVPIFPGGVYAEAPGRMGPVLPGGIVRIDGTKMIPGQRVTLMRGTSVLNPQTPIVVDPEGKFAFDLPIGPDAQPGLHPVVVLTENPSAARIVEVKISQELPISGAEKFDLSSVPVFPGPYQAAWSPRSQALFVASTAGRGVESRSALARFDATTLRQGPQTRPALAKPDAVPFAVYGVAVDDAAGTVWVTTTQQNTVAVYRQSDLSLVRQFPSGLVPHARDIVIDDARGRAYVSSAGHDEIHVFDTATLEALRPIRIPAQGFGETFTTMSLALDAESGMLMTVSLTTNELALIAPSKPPRVLPLPGAVDASGVAYDGKAELVFVASQATDNLLILRAKDGAVLHDVRTGASALSVTFDPVGQRAWVANRDSGTVTAVDRDGHIIANLDLGGLPNQVTTDGRGTIWAVTKAGSPTDTEGDRLWRIGAPR